MFERAIGKVGIQILLAAVAAGCGAVGDAGSVGAARQSLGPGCIATGQGSPSSCKDEATWSGYAGDDCAAHGLVLDSYALVEPCGDGVYRYVKYECCPPPCTPTTCVAEGANCGIIPDGCGSKLDCGQCAAGTTCGGGGTPNVCGCTPTSCEAQGKDCGIIPDGCGSKLDCGLCAPGMTCGGGGTPNVCSACLSLHQGSISACMLPADWKMAAYKDCLARGLNLTSYTVDTPCSWPVVMYRNVNYTCCP
jgi:hypothetical protein